MPSEQATVNLYRGADQGLIIVTGTSPTGLLAAAELVLVGVQVEVIDGLEEPDRLALRPTPACRETRQKHRKDVFRGVDVEDLAGVPRVDRLGVRTRSFDQGPDRDHDVQGALSA